MTSIIPIWKLAPDGEGLIHMETGLIFRFGEGGRVVSVTGSEALVKRLTAKAEETWALRSEYGHLRPPDPPRSPRSA